MNIKQLITYESALSLQATTKEVKELFNKLQTTHIPVVEKEQFLGCFSVEDIHILEQDKTLNDYQYLLSRLAIIDTANWIDVLQEFARQDANTLPVLDLDGKYLGILELEDFLHLLGKTPFLNESGAILVIETAIHHYSPSQVSQIIESNNGKILGLFVTALSESTIECTIKLNSSSINDIVQTFRRYGYTIKSEHIEDSYVQGLKERSKYLKKFLNI